MCVPPWEYAAFGQLLSPGPATIPGALYPPVDETIDRLRGRLGEIVQQGPGQGAPA
ncbi:hypothetical protein ACWD9K_18275 [Streptomyces sp. 900116325]|uniref:hypothetical protein n=1 Tax=Streptomyces sp. 900116325 TaxID=3154295 RepID=UPI0033B4E8F7